MGIVFRQSVKSSLATFAGALLGALVIYLSTYFLPKQEFGFRSTLTNYAVVAGQILLFGLHNTIAVYIHRYEPGDRRGPVLLTATMMIPALLIGAATIVYALCRESITHLFQPDDIPFITSYFYWLPLFTLLFAYQVILETYLISQLKVAKATFIREVLLRLLNILLIVLFGLNYISYDWLIYGTVLIYLIPIALLLAIAWRTEPFKFSFAIQVFSKAERFELIHFTWYHSLLSVTLTLMGMLDALMVATLSRRGLSAVPVYTISVFIISFLLIPYRAMLNSTFALLAQAFKDSNLAKAKDIFVRSSLNIFIASVAMLLLIVCNLHNAVKILPSGYEEIVPVVIILSLGRMADMITGMNDQVLSVSSHYRYNFFISIALVVLIVIFNWFLIPRYDVIGAAWGTTLAMIVYNLLKLIVVKAKLNMQPLSKRTFYVTAAGGLAFLAGYFLPEAGGPVIDAAWRSLLILCIYLAGLIYFKPSPDLVEYLASIRENKRLF